MAGPEPQLRPVQSPSTALFVDAGWLLASAGLAVLGTARREELACDYRSLLESLSAHIDRHSGGMRQLRTYWYDAAIDAVPTWEHNRIAGFPYVTVRLGRLNRDQQQKGVDVIIYRDMIKLARERAISRAYLLAGDEDLRDGILETKDVGVQVVLLGMPVDQGHNQSARLVREADEYVVLPDDVWKDHFRRREPEARSSEDDVGVARMLGERFARQWADRASEAEVREVLDGFPTLPHQLDIELLVFAEREMGSLRQRPDLKQEMRGTFWFGLKEVAAAREGAEVPDTGDEADSTPP